MSFLTKGYQDLWRAIIRPARESYAIADLGSVQFSLAGQNYQRTDLTLTNPRGLKLECSHFEPSERPTQHLPCVVYLHGNCSSRLETLGVLPELLPACITVFCFDMAGSGLSEGEYISLGWYERDDLACVVEHLRSTDSVSCIGLWGRSMGAVTALMHGDRDPSIAGMVIDSPFSSLKVLSEELAKNYSKAPGFVLKMVMSLVRKTIKKKAQFDILALNPIQYVERCFIPAYFAAATEDDFIRPSHSELLHANYAGDKNFMLVEGAHNSPRPQFFLDSIAIFFHSTLQCDLIPPRAEPQGELSGALNVPEQCFFLGASFEGDFMSEEEMLKRAIEESLKDS